MLKDQQLRKVLATVASKFNDLSEQAANFSGSDFNELAKINKEIKRLSTVKNLYDELVTLETNFNYALESLKSETDSEMVSLLKQEIAQANVRFDTIEQDIRISLLPKSENDDKNILIEMKPAAGGNEAAIFVGDLFSSYKNYASERNWKLQITEAKLSPQGGYDNLMFSITGDQVYSRFKFESGVHRVQRVPSTEANGRTHTSTITVIVLPEMDELEVKIEDKDLRIDVMRAQGAGGQSVNKTESAVRITHLPTNIVVYCQDGKSQNENKAQAMKVLRAKLWEKAETEREQELSKNRKSQVGTGDRSEKIRTYNYPQNRVTDHRIGFSVNNLTAVMNGELDILIEALAADEQKKLLEQTMNENHTA